MRGDVWLLRINGRKDAKPRQLSGELGMVVREQGGRTVRILQIADTTQAAPAMAELIEPQLMAWNYQAMEWQGYENNYGQWNLQRWRCEMERPDVGQRSY
jgi:hypothetical protein